MLQEYQTDQMSPEMTGDGKRSGVVEKTAAVTVELGYGYNPPRQPRPEGMGR